MKLSDVLAHAMCNQLVILETMDERELMRAMAVYGSEFELYLDYDVYGIGADDKEILRVTLKD